MSFCAIAAAAVMIAGCSSSSGSGSASSGATGSASANLAFFKGKTITYIVSSKPGNGQGGQILAMKPYLEKYLGATINIQYSEAGSNTVGQNEVEAANPDGLTMGDLLITSDLTAVFQQNSTLSFKMQDATLLGSTESVPDLLVACQGSPYKNFGDYASASSPQVSLEVAGAASTLFAQLVAAAYRVPGKYLTGYAGEDQEAGCARGDGNVAAGSMPNWVSSNEESPLSGTVPLLEAGPVPGSSAAKWLNGAVPTLANAAKQYPPKDATALSAAIEFFQPTTPQYATFVPSGVPAGRLQVLRAAFQYAMTQAAVSAALAKYGIYPGYVTPAAATTFINKEINKAPYYRQFMSSK
jgi:tripartite-type tricarboxylate transporter receptor subunit TctC